MFKKRDQQLLAEAYEAIHGGSDWRSEYKAVAETIYRNLAYADSARQFFGMFRRPSYLVRALNQVHDAARKEDVNLQNDPEFGKIGVIYNIDRINEGKGHSREEQDFEDWFNEEKPKVKDEMAANAKIRQLNAHIDSLGRRARGQ